MYTYNRHTLTKKDSRRNVCIHKTDRERKTHEKKGGINKTDRHTERKTHEEKGVYIKQTHTERKKDLGRKVCMHKTDTHTHRKKDSGRKVCMHKTDTH